MAKRSAAKPVETEVPVNIPPRIGGEEDTVETETNAVQDLNDVDSGATKTTEVAETEALTPTEEVKVIKEDTQTTSLPVNQPTNIEAVALASEEAIRKKLAEEPIIEMEIPLDVGEEYGIAKLPVIIGGYFYGNLPKGEPISVPKSVYEILKNKRNQINQVGRLAERKARLLDELQRRG